MVMAALIQFNDNTAHSRLWLSENENEAQALFAQCKSANINPVCQCSIHTPAMYIAQRKKYYLARMPGTGSKHAPNCPSFEVESQDKGTTVYDKSVIRTNNNGSLTLKIHAPLSRTKVVREQNSELNEEHTPTPQIPRNKNAKRDAMSLSATLGIIWEQAELNRWHPNFTGKRSWWLFRTRMLQAAENIVAKRKYLNEILYIPESFNVNKIDEIDGRRKAQFNSIMQKKGSSEQYMLVIGRIRDLTLRPTLCEIRLAQVSNNVVFWGDKGILKKIQAINYDFSDLQNNDSEEWVFTIMVVAKNDDEALMIRDIGFLRTDHNYLPHYSDDDISIQEALLENNREFIQSIHYDGNSEVICPNALLTDVGDTAIPMVAFKAFASEEVIVARAEAKERWTEQYGTVWEWDSSNETDPMPELPPIT